MSTKTTQQTVQPQPPQHKALTELKQDKSRGGSDSGQGGGHGHHGPTGLHRQNTSLTTGHQHL